MKACFHGTDIDSTNSISVPQQNVQKVQHQVGQISCRNFNSFWDNMDIVTPVFLVAEGVCECKTGPFLWIISLSSIDAGGLKG